MEIRPASDRSLLVSFGSEISPSLQCEVWRFLRAFESRPAGIFNLHPAFSSVLIDFDPRRRSHEEIERLVRERLAGLECLLDPAARTIEIPVQYGGEFGPDLDEVARHVGRTTTEVVHLHSAVDYLVYFLGFSPGFPYLGGLPTELATPRLPAPRKSVPAGSIAVGGSQAGIYPTESPGGWRIIGRTSLRLFDAAAEPAALLSAGDRVRFVAQSLL